MSTARLHNLKRTITAGEAVTVDGGRIVIVLDRGIGTGGRVLVRVDGVEVVRRMVQGERHTVDGGRVIVELERSFGKQATLYLGLAADARIDRPGDARPAREKPAPEPHGGYL